jgi:hypothetical protein
MQVTMQKAGLDVHAERAQAAVLTRDGRGFDTALHGPPLVALDYLAALGPGTTAVYEASPTGFTLVRAAAERGARSSRRRSGPAARQGRRPGQD